MFGDDRRSIRTRFVEVWRKRQAGTPLEPLEAVIAGVIESHPEYHPLFEQGDALLDREWSPEGGRENPFLHLGLHVALHEQLAVDRPPGVRAAHRRLLARLGDPLAAEHRMIECLAQVLWQAGRDGRPPDEAAYLECLQRQA